MSDLAARDRRGSPDRFGYEWQRYREIRPENEEQFRRWTAHLGPEHWRGKTFLDVGCGAGRNSYWPMTYGASGGVAVDVDDRSLASARSNLAAYPSVEVLRCSAYDLPFVAQFDIVFSIGVLQFLEYPDRALARMARAAKPGGLVLIWVYGRENNGWVISLLDPLRRGLFSRLPVGVTHHLSLYPAELLWILLRLGVRPIEYFRLLRRFHFAHVRSIVFDHLLPRIAHYWTRQEVEELMAGAGLADVLLRWVNEMSWSAIGTRRDLGLGDAQA